MDKEALKALRGSIKHWKDNVENAKAGIFPGLSRNACALCNRFYEEDCVLCPIYLKTKKRYCKRTPFWKVSELCDVEDEVNPAILEACQEELKFLKSLLPKE